MCLKSLLFVLWHHHVFVVVVCRECVWVWTIGHVIKIRQVPGQWPLSAAPRLWWSPPRSHDLALDASPRSELAPAWLPRLVTGECCSAQVSPHSIIIITEYLRWLVSTRLRQLVSSINTNQLWKSNGSIIWIKWILPFLGCCSYLTCY